jgi:hypothetical protein
VNTRPAHARTPEGILCRCQSLTSNPFHRTERQNLQGVEVEQNTAGKSASRAAANCTPGLKPWDPDCSKRSSLKQFMRRTPISCDEQHLTNAKQGRARQAGNVCWNEAVKPTGRLLNFCLFGRVPRACGSALRKSGSVAAGATNRKDRSASGATWRPIRQS